MVRLTALGCIGILLLSAVAASAADAPRDFKDVVYATVDGKPLALDVHLPAGAQQPTLLVFVHGGAWTTGSKAQYPGLPRCAWVRRCQPRFSVLERGAVSGGRA